MSIVRLDEDCSSKIRKGQVITKVSDIVRELVDNAIDADAHSVQILLDNYGLKKIEVQDNGHGIPHEDIHNLFQGGYTSKLSSDSHLSCEDKYGFRGEALSAICSFDGLIVTSKRREDIAAKKFVLSKEGKVTAENVVPRGNGTVIIVRELFKDFPVRKKHCSEPKVAKAQLKEIESNLKCLGISNPSIYFALYHNGNLIWSKPAVKNTEQALTTILGPGMAKNLSNCLSAEIFPGAGENGWRGSLNLFVPQKPVDMKNMGFTSSKMTMIFVNRRLVVIEEYQNLIKRYAVGSADRPTQQEQRKFPAAVFMIGVPPNEVDFNRDMDKSKIFLTCRDVVLTRLETMLQSYYGVNLSVLEPVDMASDNEEMNNTTESFLESLNSSSTELVNHPADVSEKCVMQLISKSMSTPEKRKEHISTFLGDLHQSARFANQKEQVSTEHHFETSRDDKTNQLPEKTFPLSDFTISFDDLIGSEDTIEKGLQGSAKQAEEISNGNNCTETFSGNPRQSDTRRSSFPQSSVNETTASHDLANPRVPPAAASTEFGTTGFRNQLEDSQPIPQCGAVLVTGGTSHLGVGERITLRQSSLTPVLTPLSKRPHDFDSFDDMLSPKSIEPAAKKFRQVTLEDLRRRDSPRPLKPVSTGSPRRLLDPVVAHGKIRSARLDSDFDAVPHSSVSALNGTKKDLSFNSTSFASDLNSSSVFGLNSSVSIHEFASWSSQSHKSVSEEKTFNVVGALGDTGTFIVKIEDLLGIFNPTKLLELRPELRKEMEIAHITDLSSIDGINFLLKEFTATIEELDPDSAQSMFYVFMDLDELPNSK